MRPPPDPLLNQEGEQARGNNSPLLAKEGVGGGPVEGGFNTIHNRAILKQRRKDLRNDSTPAERKLWPQLQHSRLGGKKFRRQHSAGPYILDFYCPSEHLAIELDGDSHFTDNAVEYDRERTAFLNALNIRVLRFLNTDVFNNLDAVCDRILEEIETPSLLPIVPNLTTPSPS